VFMKLLCSELSHFCFKSATTAPHSSRGNAVNTAAAAFAAAAKARNASDRGKSPWEISENKKSVFVGVAEKGSAVLFSSFFFVTLQSHYKLINLWRRKWKNEKLFFVQLA
jgi:hypothetical protein